MERSRRDASPSKQVKVLFQGSHLTGAPHFDSPRLLKKAQSIARALGRSVIDAGFQLYLTGACNLDREIVDAAVTACRERELDPRELIRTYLIVKEHGSPPKGHGVVIESTLRYWHQLRTKLVQEVDAVITLSGGLGAADAIEKAELLGRLIFPIPLAGAASHREWERLRDSGYGNFTAGDTEFLADISLTPTELAQRVCAECSRLVAEGRSVGGSLQPKGQEERSHVMPLTELARRFQPSMSPRKFKEVALKRYDLQRFSQKGWTVRLDSMDARTRKRFER